MRLAPSFTVIIRCNSCINGGGHRKAYAPLIKVNYCKIKNKSHKVSEIYLVYVMLLLVSCIKCYYRILKTKTDGHRESPCANISRPFTLSKAILSGRFIPSVFRGMISLFNSKLELSNRTRSLSRSTTNIDPAESVAR